MDKPFYDFSRLNPINNWEIAATVITVVVLAIFRLFDSRVYDANGKRIPGPDSNLWGKNVLTVARKGRQMKQISKTVYEEFLPLGDGNIVSYVYFGNYSVMIGHPDMVKVVLSGHHTKFPKPVRYNRLKFVLGDGLVTSSGHKWQSHRHAINLGFHAEALKGMVPNFSVHADHVMDQWTAACGQKTSAVVDFCRCITGLTLRVICQSAFGFDIAASEEVFQTAFNNFDLFANEINSRLADPTEWWPYLYSQRLRDTKQATDYFKGLIGTIISKRMALKENKKKSSGTDTPSESTAAAAAPAPADLLDILLGASEVLSQESKESTMSEAELFDHIMTFLFAGHETTASALMWLIYELCLHPDIQARCAEEADAILAGLPEGAPVPYEDIARFSYLQQVMKETNRLHPTAGMIGRVSTEGCTLGQYELLPNTTIMISTFCVHRHPDFWEAPDEFRPDRFSPENSRKTLKHPFQYIPFSAGPRNCIGQRFSQMEVVVVLARLLRRFTFSLTDENRAAVRFEEMVTSHPANMHVTVTPRH